MHFYVLCHILNDIFTSFLIIAWLEWAFMEDSDVDDDSSTSTVGASNDETDVYYPAVDLMDKLASLFMDEGINFGINGIDESDNLLWQQQRNAQAMLSSTPAALDQNNLETISPRIDGTSTSEEPRIPLNFDSFLYDDTLHSRIDYNINQMDIAKMIINASKHLNLKSIHELPIRVYQNETNASTMIGDSWHLILKASENNLDQETECVICLEKFQRGDKLRILPCGHQFHIGCIDHWLLGTYSDEECVTTGCPTCKKRVAYVGESETSDEGLVCVESPENSSFPSWAFFKLGSILSKESSSSSQSDSNSTDDSP